MKIIWAGMVVVEKVRTEPTLYIFGEKETKEDILRIFV
jgi:hypothetical protein